MCEIDRETCLANQLDCQDKTSVDGDETKLLVVVLKNGSQPVVWLKVWLQSTLYVSAHPGK